MEARINGVVIRYELEGPQDAPMITFSHSLATNLDLWDAQMPVLRGRFRILRFDTRGHGGSSAPPAPYTMESLASDVIGLLDHLKVRKTHFVGISMGGMIGQVLACRHPERIGKLILCSTTGRVPPETGPVWEERILTAQTQGMGALAQNILERLLSDTFRQNQVEITAKIRSMILYTPVAGYVGCSRAISTFNVLEELSRVSLPTLIIAGEKDESTPVEASAQIRQQIAGSELIVVPGALHLTNIEATELFNRKLADFLA